MSSNYSDSEDEDYGDFETTSVVLGYAVKEETNDKLSHLGGEPSWLVPTSPLDTRLAKCLSCNKLMTLLLQIDGKVPQSPHQQIFYVFACLQKQCRRKHGGVRAIRGVALRGGPLRREEESTKKKEEEKTKQGQDVKIKQEPRLGDLLFASDAGEGVDLLRSGAPAAEAGTNLFGSPFGNPFPFTSATSPTLNSQPPVPIASSSSPTTIANLPVTFAAALSLNLPLAKPVAETEPLFYGPPEPWPNPLPQAPFPHFFLDADSEQLDATPESLLQSTTRNLPNSQTLLSDSTRGRSSDDWGGYSKSSLDLTFQKFADRISQNPEQVLRYEHQGVPLLYSKSDPIGTLLIPLNSPGKPLSSVPACPSCRQKRYFEFQLMPHAITMLEADDPGLDGMEWGTVIVAACTCAPLHVDSNGVGYVEEWAGVQWEQPK